MSPAQDATQDGPGRAGTGRASWTCSRHAWRGTGPQGCPACLRRAAELDIVTRTLDALEAAGLAVWEHQDGTAQDSRDQTLTRLAHQGRAFVEVSPDRTAGQDAQRRIGWVLFSFGDGQDVLRDYTRNLDAILAPVTAAQDRTEGS